MERKEALQLGLKTYETGRICRNGHLTYRYASTGACSACVNGESDSENPETFLDMSQKLYVTALTTYNAELQRITSNYELMLAKSKELEDKARSVSTMRDERLASIELQREAFKLRSIDLERMVTHTIFVHFKDLEVVKAKLLEVTQRRNKHLTLDDMEFKRRYKNQPIYIVRCFKEDIPTIQRYTTELYGETNG